MSAPKVTVCVNAYNHCDYIGEAISSYAQQSYPNVEVDILDDGSTDGTGQLCEQLAAAHPNVRVRHQPNRGMVASLNTLAATCRSPYVALASSDDAFDFDKIAQQVDFMEAQPQVGACFTFVNLVDGAGTSLEDPVKGNYNQKRSQKKIVRELLYNSFLCSPSSLLRRSAVDATGLFDSSFPLAHDYEYWCRLAIEHPIEVIDQPLTTYRWHGRNGTLRTLRKRHQECWRVQVMHGPELIRHHPHLAGSEPFLDMGVSEFAILAEDFAIATPHLSRRIKTLGVNNRDLINLAYSLHGEGKTEEAKDVLALFLRTSASSAASCQKSVEALCASMSLQPLSMSTAP